MFGDLRSITQKRVGAKKKSARVIQERFLCLLLPIYFVFSNRSLFRLKHVNSQPMASAPSGGYVIEAMLCVLQTHGQCFDHGR